MADEEVATRAPESDAAEETPAPADSGRAQSGPTMGDHCVTDRPTPPGESPSGEITKLGNVDTYITKPADYPHSPSKLLLLLTGGTGIHSKNNQLQADKYASEGYLVIMPDQFNGDPAPNATTEDPTSPTATTFLDTFKLRAAETAKSFLIDMWLARHTEETVVPLLHSVLEGAKDEFADAIANGGGIYAAGYCFGAKYVMILAGAQKQSEPKQDEEQVAAPQKPLIKAGAVAHGTLITREDIAGIQAPLSIIALENDPLFSDEIREAGKKSLDENKIEYELEVYSGVPHGFAVYGDYDDSNIKSSQSKAFAQMLKWLQSH